MSSALELLFRLRAASTSEAAAIPRLAAVGGLTLAEFAASGQIVRIWSDVLNEEVLFAADNARVADTEERVVYRARELAVVWGENGDITPDALQRLHEIKKVFDGEVQAGEADEGETNEIEGETNL